MRDSLEIVASNHAPALARDLAAAQRDEDDALNDMQQALQLSPEGPPPNLSGDPEGGRINWDDVRSLLAKGKSSDPAALGTALLIANSLDTVKTAEEVMKRSNWEKFKFANVTFDYVALARGLVNPPDILAMVTPNFVVFDKPDAGGVMKNLLEEGRSSFLAQRYQRFSDLNMAFQVRAMLLNSASAYRDQAATARTLAADVTLEAAERQLYNLEAAQADFLAQKADEQADGLEAAVQSVIASQQTNIVAEAEAKATGKGISVQAATAIRTKAKEQSDELGAILGFVPPKIRCSAALGTGLIVNQVQQKSPEKLTKIAKTLAVDTFASALHRAQGSVAEGRKSLLHPKGKRKAFMEPLIPLFAAMDTVAVQPIDEKKDASADIGNAASSG